MYEWSILIYLLVAGVAAAAFLCFVRDEIRLKTYEVNELVEQVRKLRRTGDTGIDDPVDDDSEPIEIQPTPGDMKIPAMTSVG